MERKQNKNKQKGNTLKKSNTRMSMHGIGKLVTGSGRRTVLEFNQTLNKKETNIQVISNTSCVKDLGERNRN